MRRRSEDLQTRRRTLIKQPSNHSQRQQIGIDILPDDLLLEIFDSYTYLLYGTAYKTETEEWQTLVHVCRRWRSLVFASPCRLDLQLYCTPTTPARDTLDVWPALPLIIWGNMALSSGADNVIAALGQNNRVRRISLNGLAGWEMEQVLAAMQVPLPGLTDLFLISDDETPRLIPDSFLGGSTPCLRSVTIEGIPLPGLPRLLLTAPHLVYLKLINVPHSGYFSPESIVALLSVLSSLVELSLDFRSPQSRPDSESRHPPPPKRFVVPALEYFLFKGVTEYLEDLVTFINTPQLGKMYISLFNQIDFDTPRLAQFVSRTFKLAKSNSDARVEFNDSRVVLRLEYTGLEISISCRELDWQLSSIEQVCNSLHLLSTVENLYIGYRYDQLVRKGDPIENTLWLQLLLPFTAVRNLFLSNTSSQGIAAALQELVGGRITEVLPCLRNIFVWFEALEHFQETIGQFVTARKLSVSDWPAGW